MGLYPAFWRFGLAVGNEGTGVTKDVLSDIRLADQVRRYGASKANSYKSLCLSGTIADLKSGDGEFLKNKPMLASEFTDLIGKSSALETRAFFARELPKPGLAKRSWQALKARFGFGGK